MICLITIKKTTEKVNLNQSIPTTQQLTKKTLNRLVQKPITKKLTMMVTIVTLTKKAINKISVAKTKIKKH